MSVPFHSASLRATGGTLPLRCMKYFLCTILRLCEGTPLRQLWINFFWWTLPRVPELKIAISQFLWAGQHNKGKCTQPMRSLCFPTFSPQLNFTHALTFYLYPSKEISMSVPCHSALLCATGGNFPLRCVKYFLCSVNLFFLQYCHNSRGRLEGGGYRRRISIYDTRKKPEEGGLQAN